MPTLQRKPDGVTRRMGLLAAMPLAVAALKARQALVDADAPLARAPLALARRAGLEPDPWQAELLQSAHPRILLNCARQSGKSTMAAVLATHTALYQPGALVLLLSPSLRQSGELFRKVLDCYHASGRLVPAEAESALRLELDHGSRIVSLPGREDTIRGYSAVRLLVIDEAAWVPESVYRSVRPMLAVSGGRLIALSTPFGTRGWFFEAWDHGEDPWHRIAVPATACPRISPAFLAQERRTLGDFWYEQEYLCRFIDSQSAAFRAADIERTLDPELEAWRL